MGRAWFGLRNRAGFGLLLILTSCIGSQLGPWLDESGQPLEGSQVLQYRGFEECAHEDVVFLSFFGRTFAQDDDGVLGQLTSEEGEVLTFAILEQIPEGVTPRGLTLGDREIYFDDSTLDDYLYIHRQGDGQTERWPRAESDCDRRPGPDSSRSTGGDPG